MNIIYYQTKTKFINTGDALINKALLDTLRNYGIIKCNCSNDIPGYFIKELGIKDSEKIQSKTEFGFVRTILKDAIHSRKEKNNVYIVSGLGHNFGGSLKKCVRNLIASVIFSIYHLFGVKTIRIGMSIGPVTKRLAFTEKIRGYFVDYYYVRDSKSLKLCHDIGIKKAKLCPDMSWIFDKNLIRKKNQNNKICINLRKSIFDTEDDKVYQQKMIEMCDQIINLISKENDEIIFCYQVQEDKDYCQEIYNFFKNKYNCKMVAHQIRLSDAEKTYGSSDYIISNRMHSLLFAYKYGALPIALIDSKKHTKIQQTFDDCDLHELIVDIYSGTKKEIQYIAKNSKNLYKKLIEVEKQKQKEILAVLDDIFRKNNHSRIK